ncbi:MYG1 exonuclease [Nymphalis io]|uniref:MYG1 exonuclease n=1 Tax=Inachis io TaxID=171585 RepID=UPI00216927E1|nr:MYG1 exonuclease [Nymphalis io]
MFKNIVYRVHTSFYKYSKRHYFTANRRFNNFFKIMKIGTHDGVFHCDDVLACFLLKRLPEFKDAEIIRTRDLEKINQCDIVVDVGAEFNHEKKRYDHHQREFSESLSSLRPELGDKYKIKLSSAGLVYAFYGEKVIQSLVNKDHPLSPEVLKLIYKKVYEHLIEEIDAIDNGVPMTNEEPRYNIRTHLSARIHRLNPDWNSKLIANIEDAFQKALALVGEEFLYNVNYFLSVWLPARDYVKSSLEERYQVHESGKIVEFKERFPWKEHLFELEKEMGLGQEVLYVVFNDKPKSWRVQAIPVSPSSFITRKALHKKWWGIRDEILSDVAGIKDCIFCHSTGFIGGNATREGAIAMAITSLQADMDAE